MENSRPKPGRMEETLEGDRGPPRAVAPLEREREMVFNGVAASYLTSNNLILKHFRPKGLNFSSEYLRNYNFEEAFVCPFVIYSIISLYNENKCRRVTLFSHVIT